MGKFRYMFVLSIIVISALVMTGCGSSKDASAENSCEAPDTYDKANLDTFLKGSYDVCVSLSNANTILVKTNKILGHPNGPLGWAADELAKKGSQAASDPGSLLKMQVAENVPAIEKLLPELEKAITTVPSILSSAPDALSDAQSLSPLKISGAVGSANDAKGNLAKASDDLPKVIAGLKSALTNLKKL